MSQYYTYISRKQIGAIFANYKQGKLQMTDEDVKLMYDRFSEVRGFNNNANYEDALDRMKAAIDSVFAGDLEEAQTWLNGALGVYKASYGC